MSCQKNYNKLLQQYNNLSEQNKNYNNLDKFNAMIDQASSAVTCDSNCQKQKTSESLEQKYLNAQTNLATAPNNVYVSRKNLIVYEQGVPAYDELIDSELLQAAEKLSTYFNTNFNDECQNILFNVETYNGLLINLANVFDLYLKYKRENIELFKKLKEETSDVLTNDRKTFYQDQGIDNLKFVYYYVILIIYVIAVLCYVAFSFLYPSNLSVLLRIVILILMILLPFLSTWILGKIIEIMYDIYNLLPKNVNKQL
jgi:hypothetical protein